MSHHTTYSLSNNRTFATPNSRNVLSLDRNIPLPRIPSHWTPWTDSNWSSLNSLLHLLSLRYSYFVAETFFFVCLNFRSFCITPSCTQIIILKFVSHKIDFTFKLIQRNSPGLTFTLMYKKYILCNFSDGLVFGMICMQLSARWGMFLSLYYLDHVSIQSVWARDRNQNNLFYFAKKKQFVNKGICTWRNWL